MIASKVNDRKRIETFTNLPAPELLSLVEALPGGALDDLPFGVIRLDGQGRVVFYSRTEARQSGYGGRTAVGQKFFSELAPCMGSPEFMRRLEKAQLAGKLDIMFEQVGDFDDAERELQVRMITASDGGLWVFLQRPAR